MSFAECAKSPSKWLVLRLLSLRRQHATIRHDDRPQSKRMTVLQEQGQTTAYCDMERQRDYVLSFLEYEFCN